MILYKPIISCKIFSHFGFRIQKLRSTLSGRHFGAKTSQTICYGSTHFNSWSGFPDPDQLTYCTIYRCLFVEIQSLRNQILWCQHIFYYNYIKLYIIRILNNYEKLMTILPEYTNKFNKTRHVCKLTHVTAICLFHACGLWHLKIRQAAHWIIKNMRGCVDKNHNVPIKKMYTWCTQRTSNGRGSAVNRMLDGSTYPG